MRLRTILPTAVISASLLAPAAASADFPHVVSAGESLSSVAAADGLSVSQLAAANGLSSSSQLVDGSTLMIPPQGDSSQSAPAVSAVPVSSSSASSSGDGDNDSDDAASGSTVYASTSAASSAGGGYLVQPGDTLWAIAMRAGITVAQLATSNGIDPNAPLLAGSTLAVAGASATAAPTLASADSQPVGAVAEGNPTAPPYPTPERMSASQVGAIASAYGVPPSLAEAVGWQESGFNNDLVSTADARGVMQILPGTWNWIQRTLSAGAPLAPASAASNVRGGVLLLRSLLNSTGGDPALAAAGYFQGLSSVQQNGMYSSTQQYVGDVMSLAQRFGGG